MNKIYKGIKGFTLFELIVVLVIAGMATSIVGPRLVNSLEKMNSKTAAKKIAACLRYARTKAASEKVPYVSVFDFNTNQLVIKKKIDEQEILNDKKLKIYLLPEGVRFKQGVSGSGEVIFSESFSIIFFPGGGSSGGKIILSDIKERELSINVDFITGLVKLS